MRNLKFLLYEVFDAESMTRYPYFQDHNREVFDMVLETGLKMGKDIMFPLLAEMDKKPPEFVNGIVKVHPMVKPLMKACGEGGWIAAHAPYDRGGQQIPSMIITAFRFIFSAAKRAGSFLVTSSPRLKDLPRGSR